MCLPWVLDAASILEIEGREVEMDGRGRGVEMDGGRVVAMDEGRVAGEAVPVGSCWSVSNLASSLLKKPFMAAEREASMDEDKALARTCRPPMLGGSGAPSTPLLSVVFSAFVLVPSITDCLTY